MKSITVTGLMLLVCSCGGGEEYVMDCPNTYECATEGKCYWNGEKCLPAREEHCRQSRLCKIAGLCSFNWKGICVARNEDDCMNSDLCLSTGNCIPHSYLEICVTCEDSYWCTEKGHCTNNKYGKTKDTICIATSEKDCKNSTMCKDYGQCVLYGNICSY